MRLAALILIYGLLSPQALPARIHRSTVARHQFMRQHPCPSTGLAYGHCPGFVIDHVRPLACGGPDRPVNMQWQTVEAAKLKDKWELNCKGRP